MLKLNNVDFELPTLCREPSCGYTLEYNEYKMISGRVRRVTKGRRFSATFSFAALTDEQLSSLKAALNAMQADGHIYMEMETGVDTFKGEVLLTMNSEQTRFRYDSEKKQGVWVNWSFTAQSMDLDATALA